MCTMMTDMPSTQATAVSSTVTTMVTTQWMLAHGMDTLRVLQVFRAADSTYRGKARIRFAAVRTDQPGAWTDSATLRSTNGAFAEDFDTSGTTDPIRVQVASAGSATSGVAEALVRVQGSRSGHAKLLGTRRVNITPSTNSTQTSYEVLYRVPAQNLAGFMAACQVRVEGGTLAYGFGYRVYTDGTEPSGAWTSLSSYTSITADELRNTGELAVTPGTNLWCELAVKWAGTDVVGAIEVTASALWS